MEELIETVHCNKCGCSDQRSIKRRIHEDPNSVTYQWAEYDEAVAIIVACRACHKIGFLNHWGARKIEGFIRDAYLLTR